MKYLLLAVIASSCKNDLKLDAPYREIPSVFAVLNAKDSKQVVRINKVFLGEGDANVMAKIPDSVNYAPDELTVSLKRYLAVNAGYVQLAAAKDTSAMEIFFDEEVVTTSPGAFATTQRVYTTSHKLYELGDYVLTIKNNHTGNIFTAKATAFDSVNGETGVSPFSRPFYADYTPTTQPVYYMNYSDVGTTYNVSFRPLSNSPAKLYQLVLRVHFYDSTVTGNRYDYVDYEFAAKPESDKQRVNYLGDYMKYSFKRDEFFNAMGVALSRKSLSDNVIGRVVYQFEYLAWAASQDYADYVLYNSPSFGINQQAPIFTNFDKGAAIGIFTFRSRCSVRKKPAAETLNEFSRNPNTCNYRFMAADGSIIGCR